MDLIAGIANMRARNYSIPEFGKLKGKFIPGRIIPIIATSTAMATGLVCLELYKVLNDGHKVDDFRNTFVNLALRLLSHLVHLSLPSRTREWNMVTSTQELGNYVVCTVSPLFLYRVVAGFGRR
ncbi:hypothetical protein OIU77_024834 [Salix suchowensis]|uniref:Uncharacterized protein n=1 Tax=Salix suchowensis TaxID=1278906 RepID=A0ABQ9BU36_9ROSI|nr:hypothetical protein OIU78_011563 [Salix suchowensis]KAJ6390698.1 hypothetical protein OIU77_024834 [Salix suchowensis]